MENNNGNSRVFVDGRSVYIPETDCVRLQKDGHLSPLTEGVYRVLTEKGDKMVREIESERQRQEYLAKIGFGD